MASHKDKRKKPVEIVVAAQAETSNPLRLFCVSVLIPSTRQAMSGFVFAETEDEALTIYEDQTGLKRASGLNLVVDEVDIEKGLFVTAMNDRDVIGKYFPHA